MNDKFTCGQCIHCLRTDTGAKCKRLVDLVVGGSLPGGVMATRIENLPVAGCGEFLRNTTWAATEPKPKRAPGRNAEVTAYEGIAPVPDTREPRVDLGRVYLALEGLTQEQSEWLKAYLVAVERCVDTLRSLRHECPEFVDGEGLTLSSFGRAIAALLCWAESGEDE